VYCSRRPAGHLALRHTCTQCRRLDKFAKGLLEVMASGHRSNRCGTSRIVDLASQFGTLYSHARDSLQSFQYFALVRSPYARVGAFLLGRADRSMRRYSSLLSMLELRSDTSAVAINCTCIRNTSITPQVLSIYLVATLKQG
jgi:hypothetical protein